MVRTKNEINSTLKLLSLKSIIIMFSVHLLKTDQVKNLTVSINCGIAKVSASDRLLE